MVLVVQGPSCATAFRPVIVCACMKRNAYTVRLCRDEYIGK